MQRPTDPAAPGAAELAAAEMRGQLALRAYFNRQIGLQKLLAEATGLHQASLCRMSKHKAAISFEDAVLIDIATKGELRAEDLCPSRADLLTRLLLQRAVDAGKAA